MMKHLLFLTVLVCAGFITTVQAQNHSVLSQGNWVKIATEKAGVYRLTYYDLKEMGVDVENLNSNQLNLYGLPAGALDETYSDDFVYDLQKMAIIVDDSGDGTFDAGDFLLFYGQGPVTWNYNEGMNAYRHAANPYCNKVFYYLRTDDTDPKRMDIMDYNSEIPTDTISTLTLSRLHEKELYNPLHSGQTWVGEMFDDTVERVFNYDFSGHTISGGKLYFTFGTNATEYGMFKVYLNDELVDTVQTFITSDNGFYAYKMQYDTVDLPELGNTFQLKFVFDKPNDSAFAYLDYFELNLNDKPVIVDPVESVEIKSLESFGDGIYYYRLTNIQPYNFIWDVTDPLNVSIMKSKISSDTLSFIDNRPGREYFLINYAPGFVADMSDGSQQMIYIVGDNNLPQPELIGMVNNQDIIGSEPANLIIVTTGDLNDAANQLATFHQEHDNLTTQIYQINEVYNEFSAGRVDPVAIRNLMALKSNQSGKESQLKYLLLFGPATFDFRGIIYPDQHEMVPTYESPESGSYLRSYSTDMFFSWFNDKYNVAVGRIPVTDAETALDMVEKLEHYSTSVSFNQWKNMACLIADNGDNGLHSLDQDTISGTILYEDENMIPDKLYLSLYEGGENGYPQVKEQLNNNLLEGRFLVSFSGHSNWTTLTKENIFSREEAETIQNYSNMPVWINGGFGTARFDDPEIKSLGTGLLLNKNGGAIVYIGNTGAAFASANRNHLLEFSSNFFNAENKNKTIGEVFTDTYSEPSSSQANHWNLIGDPALKPAWPHYSVQTDSVNGIAVELLEDTIAPGSKLRLKGRITDADGNVVSSFSGKILVTVFDMPYVKQTIEGEFDPVRDITLYDSLLAEKPFEVVDGYFSDSLTMPAMYHEKYGKLKIVYYGISQQEDATGSLNSVVYGGEVSTIHEDPALAEIKVYPVPFYDKINLFVPSVLSQRNLDVTVTDAVGKVVYRQKLNTGSSSSTTSIDLPHLPVGIYFLNILSDKGRHVIKLIKK